MYEGASLGGTVLFFGYLLPNLLSIDFGLHVASWMWWPAAMLSAAFVAYMSYRGIKVSLNYAYIMGAIELVVFLAVSILLLGQPGVHGSGAVFSAQLSPTGFPGVMMGVVFAFLSFTGFGAAIPLGEETRDPLRNITIAILVSVIGIGLFYVFVGYVSVVAWGPHHMSTYASSTIPFVTLTLTHLSRFWVWALTILTLNGSLACALAIHNVQVRLLYALGRDGLIVSPTLGTTHERYQTPARAVLWQTAVTVVVVTVAGALWGPLEGFFMLGTIATLGALLVRLGVNISVGPYYRQRQMARWLWHYGVPWLGVVFILLPIYFTLVAAPAYPVLLSPYVGALWLLAGLFVVSRVSAIDTAWSERVGKLGRAQERTPSAPSA